MYNSLTSIHVFIKTVTKFVGYSIDGVTNKNFIPEKIHDNTFINSQATMIWVMIFV